MVRYSEYDEDDEYGDMGSEPVVNQQHFLYDELGFHGPVRDWEAHNLFWDVMYNDDLSRDQRIQAYDELAAYLMDEYGIDFAEVWDWDAFREWYDTVS